MRPTDADEEFEVAENLATATHVDVSVARAEGPVDKCTLRVEKTRGACARSKRTCSNSAVRRGKMSNWGVAMDRGERTKQLRLARRAELTGAEAAEKAAHMVQICSPA